MSWRSVLLVFAVFLAGCLPKYDPYPPPTVGPVRGLSGGGGTVHLTLLTSANCVDPGRDLEFTVIIKNKMPYPVPIISQPLVDIIITSQSDPSLPQQRWSQSDSYPAKIEAVLAPNEERTYRWVWRADPAYSAGAIATARARVNGGDVENNMLMESQIYFGVKYLYEVNQPWLCSQLNHAQGENT